MVLLFSCGGGYRTLQHRQREFTPNKVLLGTKNLSREEIKYILSTKPTSTFPIDISILINKDYGISATDEYEFTKEMIFQLRKSDKVKRIIPIPDFIKPNILKKDNF